MKIDNFRANLKKRIKEMGYTQEEFSNKIEISNASLKKYMSNGKNTSLPDIEIFDKMCTVLDCDYDYLMGEIDTPHRYVYDIKEVIGLSDESISILVNDYVESKPSIDFTNIQDEANLLLKETDDKRASIYNERLSIIDFIIKNSVNNNFLWYLYMYLFSDFTTNNKKDDFHKTVALKDKNSGYTIYFGPNIAKESLLTKITFQIQKWKEEIEKQKKKDKKKIRK